MPAVFRLAWVRSEVGTASHLAAGKVPQGCTNLPPHTSVQDIPVSKKENSTTLIQKPMLACKDFHHRRPVARHSGTSACAQLPPLRGQNRYRPVTIITMPKPAATSITRLPASPSSKLAWIFRAQAKPVLSLSVDLITLAV